MEIDAPFIIVDEGIIEGLVGVQAQSGSAPYDPVIYK